MKMKSKLKPLIEGVLALSTFALLSSPSDPLWAMTIGHSENSAENAQPTIPTAKMQSKPISFIAWEDNRLITTAGAFIITKSVKLLDLAGSQHLEKGFKGPAPSVYLTIRNRKLISVIIK